MYRLAILSLCLLIGCVAPSQIKVGNYRPAKAAIYSSAVLQPDRLAGHWVQVAGFAPAAGGCGAGGVDIAQKPGGLTAAYRLCLTGAEMRGGGAMVPAGPGRFTVPGQTGPWWVLWADADYRTLVIGTPSGQFGFILNRDGNLPPDRMRAAREILDWNGYDLKRLQVF